jgi:N-methylhydantoinase A/acetone carboxylase, beta subunit
MLARTPIQTVMSGPGAGVIGGRHLGDVKGIDNLITFDTGGTSSEWRCFRASRCSNRR